MLKRIIIILLLLGYGETKAATASETLSQLLNNIHTLRADFAQATLSSKDIVIGQVTTGQIQLVRPEKIRWDIQQPNRQITVLVKDSLILYDLDLAQATKRKLSKNSENIFPLLLRKPEALKNMFTIKMTIGRTQQFRAGNIYNFILSPKNPAKSEYSWVKLRFVTGVLQEVSLLDQLNQHTKIKFSRIVLNKKIPPQNFILTFPKEVDIFCATN